MPPEPALAADPARADVEAALAALRPGLGWAALRAGFRWPAPARFDMASALVGARARATPDRLAIRAVGEDGARADWSFGALDRAAARLANALAAHGLSRGDRVAILLPQCAEALVAHLAAWRLGAVSTPLFTRFGAEAVAFRLADSGAAALVTCRDELPKLAAARAAAPELRLVVSTDGGGEGTADWAGLLARASDAQTPAASGPDDPAFLAYTSGTTGAPKGALHGHRLLIGHLPAALLVHGFPAAAGELWWTPSDWAWMGGLCNALMPALWTGAPILAWRDARFDPGRAFRLMREEGVTRLVAPPTALRLMRQAEGAPVWRLRSVGSAGESLGAEILDWGRAAFGATIHEFYGQTECNMVTANNAAIAPLAAGSMGRPTPGFDVAVLDADGRPLPPGETGEIAVRRGAASMFLGYRGRPDLTAAKFAGDWMLTGDEGRADAEGRLFFSGRADDVITSAGYRIGPAEIEDCLARHPAVAAAAVVGLPDPVRTEIVAAFVVPRAGLAGDDALAEALVAHVRDRLGAHVAPRRVRFEAALPMTATGKIMRRELRRREGG
jgi:acetyl-CoA synthetase